MLKRFARSKNVTTVTRLGFRAGLASLALLAGAGSVHDASAVGETRTLSFHHTHSGEDLTVTFKRNGRYDEAALKSLNHFLRDWRSQDQTKMDPHLFDILWEVYRDVDARQPIQIVSAYRSPATNAMLRRRSAHTGVARFSQHMLGHAMDFYIPGVALEQIRFAGLRLQRGGVGFYPTSGSPFVHLDTGNIRHWPRMTREQLVRVFPNGRTVHIPTDGNPLPGYELALADIEHRRGEDGEPGTSLASKSKSFLASLFGKQQQQQADDDDESSGPVAAGGSAAAAPTVVAAAVVTTDKVPMPRAKPAALASYQVASAAPSPSPPRPANETADASRPQTPADIINARGFWDDVPAQDKKLTPAQIALLRARSAFAQADPQDTASIPPQALAYAAVKSQREPVPVVTASAPVPHFTRPRNPAVTTMGTVVTKGTQGGAGLIATSTRLSMATNTNTVFMRAMILSPSASATMRASTMGDQDLTVMKVLFVKPATAIAADFNGDPQFGLQCERFTGSATATLPVQSFRTASLK